ncbi:MAG TPA: hypothetical protein PLO50_08150 [Nitrospira sp.]|nr:hypothetical protein [Nitrospira sp.]
MKGLLIALSGTIILTSSLVYGQSDTQAIDQGNMNHGQWIERSFDRGQLDRRQEVRPEREPAPPDRTEHHAKTVTKKKAAPIGAAQKHTSRPLVRERHDHRDARHR